MTGTFIDYGTVGINPILREIWDEFCVSYYLEFLISMYYIIVLGGVIRIRQIGGH